MDKEIVEFIVKCRNWLVPLGFYEIFSDNHPNISDFNIHFIKDGIRVECRKRYSREECSLTKMVSSNNKQIPLTVSTGNYEIGTDELDIVYKTMDDYNVDSMNTLMDKNNFLKNRMSLAIDSSGEFLREIIDETVDLCKENTEYILNYQTGEFDGIDLNSIENVKLLMKLKYL